MSVIHLPHTMHSFCLISYFDLWQSVNKCGCGPIFLSCHNIPRHKMQFIRFYVLNSLRFQNYFNGWRDLCRHLTASLQGGSPDISLLSLCVAKWRSLHWIESMAYIKAILMWRLFYPQDGKLCFRVEMCLTLLGNKRT